MHQNKRQDGGSLEDRQRKASPKLWAREVEVSEALAPKSMASLDSRSKPRPHSGARKPLKTF